MVPKLAWAAPPAQGYVSVPVLPATRASMVQLAPVAARLTASIAVHTASGGGVVAVGGTATLGPASGGATLDVGEALSTVLVDCDRREAMSAAPTPSNPRIPTTPSTGKRA